jgi:signal peptidase I
MDEIAARLVKKSRQWRGAAISDSMAPLIVQGDQMEFFRVPAPQLRRFDIIAYQDRNKKIRVHRIVHIVHNNATLSFITRGDNTLSEDAPVSSDLILGKALYVRNTYKNIYLHRRFHAFFLFLPKGKKIIRLFNRLLQSKKVNCFFQKIVL